MTFVSSGSAAADVLDRTLAWFADGGLVMLVEDRRPPAAGRSRPGGLLVARACVVGAHTVNMMARDGRGVVAVTVAPSLADRLGLREMPALCGHRSDRHYLVSVEAAACTGTGISAHDRAETLRAVAHGTGPDAVRMPGHIQPVLIDERPTANAPLHGLAGYLATLCGDEPCTAWCDVLNADGDVATPEQCRQVAMRHGLPVVAASTLTMNIGMNVKEQGVINV